MQNRGTLRIVEAIFQIFRLLSSGVHSLKDLAREVEVSERTVQRYMQEMRNTFKLQIDYDRTRQGYVLRAGGLPLAQARLSDGELLALYVAAPLLAQYQGTPLEARFREAFAKLCELLPERVVDSLPRLDSQIAVKATLPSSNQVERFEQVLDAVRRQRRLWLRYFSNYKAQQTEREVDPYGLYQVGWRWYLVGRCHLRQNLRFFELSRIRDLRLLPVFFERPADFVIGDVLQDSLGAITGQGPAREIVLHFDAFAARYLRETRLHASQTQRNLPGGGLELRLQVALTDDVERLLLGWAEHVRVQAPESLQRRLLQRHTLAASQALAGLKQAEREPVPSEAESPRQLRLPFVEG